MASLDVLRIFIATDIDVIRRGVRDKLSVACIITEIMVASMMRAVAEGRQLPFAKSQFATVAQHLAHRATSCSLDSINQALQPTRLVKGRPLVAALKVLLTDGEELEASVLEIIEAMGRSGSFSTTLLQPWPWALKLLSGAWQSVHDAKVTAALADVENVGNAPLQPAGTPERKKQLQDACDVVDEEVRSSGRKLLKLQATVEKLAVAVSRQHEAVSRQHEVAGDRHDAVRTALEFNTQQLEFNTQQQATGFNRVETGLNQVGQIALQSLQNMRTMAREQAGEQEAQQAYREQSVRSQQLLREVANGASDSFELLISQVTT